jgi:hypothetical protein
MITYVVNNRAQYLMYMYQGKFMVFRKCKYHTSPWYLLTYTNKSTAWVKLSLSIEATPKDVINYIKLHYETETYLMDEFYARGQINKLDHAGFPNAPNEDLPCWHDEKPDIPLETLHELLFHDSVLRSDNQISSL